MAKAADVDGKWCGAPFPLLDDSNVYGKITSGQLQEFPTLSHAKSSKSTSFNMDLNIFKRNQSLIDLISWNMLEQGLQMFWLSRWLQ